MKVSDGLSLRKKLFATLLLAYPIIMFVIFSLYIYISAITLAFQSIDDNMVRTFLPWNDFFKNFKEFFSVSASDGNLVGVSIYNSLKTWFLSLIISNPLYFIVSYFLFKKTFGHKIIEVVVMLPNIISSMIFCLLFKQVVEGPLIEIMELLGFENFPNMLSEVKYNYFVVLFYRIWCSFGMSCIYYVNAMNSIDPGILESSKIDGISNMFQELWYIILPLIFSTFKTFFVLGLSQIFITDGGLLTFFMYGAPTEIYHFGYYNTVKIYNAKFVRGYPRLAAGGLVMTAIVAPIVVISKKLMDKIDPAI